ncbi:MAG: tetratricopeptide repeat protein [Chitinivibrionales bacterium]|nr:tetratricopeptide repeat protein [Chitinivibrionales bacterium]
MNFHNLIPLFKKHISSLVPLLLIIAVGITYWPLHKNGFLQRYDDYDYIVENEHVNTGLTFPNIQWAFFSSHAANWHPMTWISHMLDCHIYGLNPNGHHFTNLLIHIANSILLYFLLLYGSRCPWRSLFVALLFALHPINVQSVAWAAERKELLSTFFGFLSLRAYFAYGRHPNINKYLFSLLCFLLALMSKAMLVTLPFLLFLLDYWPLKRIPFHGPGKLHLQTASGLKRSALIIIAEKAPYFVASIAVSIITIVTQKQAGAMAPLESIPLLVRLANAITSYCAYISKLIWPTNLSVIYPHPGMPNPLIIFLSFIVLSILIFLAIKFITKAPWMFIGLFWYLGTLLPVIGFVQVGEQPMADRYAYFPFIGLYILLSWSMGYIVQRTKFIILIPATIVLVFLAGITQKQITYWRDSISLFQHAVNATEQNYLAHYNLAYAFADNGQFEKAIHHYKHSITIQPSANSYNNLGVVYLKLNEPQKALLQFFKVLELDPEYEEAYYNLGMCYARIGKVKRAIRAYQKALESNPEYWEALNNIGLLYLRNGSYKEAVCYFTKSLHVNKKNISTYLKRGKAYHKMGKIDSALSDYLTVLGAYPQDAYLLFEIGLLYELGGAYHMAVEKYSRAAQIMPENKHFKNKLKTIRSKIPQEPPSESPVSDSIATSSE